MTRGRKPNPEPTTSVEVSLPESIRTRLDLLLFSEAEGRVPHGAYKRFFMELLAGFFGTQALDLAPYVGAPLGELVIRGKPRALEALRQTLERKA